MRNVFCQSLVTVAALPEFVFLTGDLGYKALEPLRDALGKRFLNAGVAEQNMISVAAGLARNGCRPWAYSIAPFAYARPFEQIRNDVCLHSLPVVIVGNGGGYGYGSMGATHHALEDYGALLCLPHLRAYIPAFDSDVSSLVPHLFAIDHPAYLRLGLAEEPKGFVVPSYAPWRKLLHGGGPTLVVVGPLVGGIVDAVRHLEHAERPDVWLLSELPLAELPDAFRADLNRSQSLVIIEEHVAQGGAGSMLATALMSAGCAPRRFTQRTALGYVSGLYGSQKFHRAECGLDPTSVAQLVSSVSQECAGVAL
jgi:transketolase